MMAMATRVAGENGNDLHDCNSDKVAGKKKAMARGRSGWLQHKAMPVTATSIINRRRNSGRLLQHLLLLAVQHCLAPLPRYSFPARLSLGALFNTDSYTCGRCVVR
jgi:hypothetical protein